MCKYFVACMPVLHSIVPVEDRRGRKSPVPPELVLCMVVRHHVGARTQARVSLEE